MCVLDVANSVSISVQKEYIERTPFFHDLAVCYCLIQNDVMGCHAVSTASL